MARAKLEYQTVPWLIRLPTDLAEAIDQRAKDGDLSRVEIVRRMLRWALAQPQKKSGSTP